ncbi:hypothetical protein KIPB_013782, partial [Kipferlia bialata]|eukprot:g13782.t1
MPALSFDLQRVGDTLHALRDMVPISNDTVMVGADQLLKVEIDQAKGTLGIVLEEI